MKRSGKRTAVRILLVAIALLAVVLLVLLGSIKSGLSSEIELARKAGIPLTREEFQKSDPFPQSQNASADFESLDRKIQSLLDDIDRARLEGSKGMEFEKPEFRKRLAVVFQTNKALVDQIDALAIRPFDQASAPDNQDGLSGLTGAINVLCYKARLDAYDPSSDAALNDLKIAFAAANPATHASNFMFSRLGRSPLAALEAFVALHAAEPTSLDAADRLIDTLEVPVSYVPPIAANLLTIRDTLRGVNQGSQVNSRDVNDHVGPESNFPWIRDIWETDVIRYARNEVSIVGREPIPLAVAIDRFETAEKRLDEGKAFKASFGTYFQFRSGIPELLQDELARIRLLHQYIASLRVKNQAGKFPTSLPLSGDAAVDPFTNKALKFLPQKDGFTIYSLGPSKIDVGGTRSQFGNITLSYPPKTN